MAKKLPQFITGVTFFVDGVGMLGTSDKLSLPEVKQKRETVSSGGFEQSHGTGVFEAMEAEFTLTNADPMVYLAAKKIGALIIAKGSIKEGTKNIPAMATMVGDLEVKDSDWATGEKVERTVKIYCSKYKLMINGIPEVVMDADNMIALIGGEDHMADLRSHIGG